MPIRATVWGENVHEQKNKFVAENYPKGMHGQIAALLSEDKNIVASTVTLQDVEHGMTEAKLDQTDVLLWWGHAAHDQVDRLPRRGRQLRTPPMHRRMCRRHAARHQLRLGRSGRRAKPVQIEKMAGRE